MRPIAIIMIVFGILFLWSGFLNPNLAKGQYIDCNGIPWDGEGQPPPGYGENCIGYGGDANTGGYDGDSNTGNSNDGNTGGIQAPLPNFLACGDAQNGFGCIVNSIISKLKLIVLPIFIIMVFYAGFLFLKSGGNEEKVSEARRTLTWAVVGYGVILVADVLVTLIKNLLGAK